MPANPMTVTVGDQTLEFDTKKQMLKRVGYLILRGYDQPVTLRQLYYQFVGHDLVENKVSQYQYLSEAMTEARIDGLIPWEWIEDRTRRTHAGDHNDGDYVTPDARFRGNLRHFIETPDRFYRPRWQFQPKYVETWVEKEALAGIFTSVCRDLKVVTFPSKGYTSTSLLKEAADRIQQMMGKDVYDGGPPVRSPYILYFGDYDPSGQDIERNIREKLQDTFHVPVTVERCALTRDQIDEFELPPQPAKRADARYEQFVAEHGNIAVELDALPPEELRRLIRESVEAHFDDDVFETEVKPKQKEERETIRGHLDDVLVDDEVEEWLDG